MGRYRDRGDRKAIARPQDEAGSANSDRAERVVTMIGCAKARAGGSVNAVSPERRGPSSWRRWARPVLRDAVAALADQEHALGEQGLLHALGRVAELDALLGQAAVGVGGGEGVVGAARLDVVAGGQHLVDVGARTRQAQEELAEGAERSRWLGGSPPSPAGWSPATAAAVEQVEQLLDAIGEAAHELLAAFDLELALAEVDPQPSTLIQISHSAESAVASIVRRLGRLTTAIRLSGDQSIGQALAARRGSVPGWAPAAGSARSTNTWTKWPSAQAVASSLRKMPIS